MAHAIVHCGTPSVKTVTTYQVAVSLAGCLHVLFNLCGKRLYVLRVIEYRQGQRGLMRCNSVKCLQELQALEAEFIVNKLGTNYRIDRMGMEYRTNICVSSIELQV